MGVFKDEFIRHELFFLHFEITLRILTPLLANWYFLVKTLVLHTCYTLYILLILYEYVYLDKKYNIEVRIIKIYIFWFNSDVKEP